jgi:hypothetical protein
MCHELLRLKRGKKADVKFISGFPSFRPGFSAAALRQALGKGFAHFLALIREDNTPDIQDVVALMLKSGFSVPDLLAAGFQAKDVFLSAFLSKIDVKVLLKLDAPYNFTDICKP